jgi:hypothetical protein
MNKELLEAWRLCPYIGYCEPGEFCIKCSKVKVIEIPKSKVTYNEFIPYMEPEEKK